MGREMGRKRETQKHRKKGRTRKERGRRRCFELQAITAAHPDSAFCSEVGNDQAREIVDRCEGWMEDCREVGRGAESLTLVGAVLLQEVESHQPPSLLLLLCCRLQLILQAQPE